MTRWSWLMLPAAAGALVLGEVVGSLLMRLLGVPEGEVLSSAGVRGWLAGALVVLVSISPLAAGVLLADRALRYGIPGRSWIALLVNAVVLVFLLVAQVLQLALS